MAQSIQLSIPSMKCGGCATAISDALKGSSKIQNIEINLANKKLDLISEVSSNEIKSILAEAGFEAHEITS